MGWTLVDDFGDDTYGEAKCFLLGTIRQKEDPGVFRADLIEGGGFIDLSCQAIADAASTLGWSDPNQVARLKQQVELAEEGQALLREQLAAVYRFEEMLKEAVVLFPEAQEKPAGKKKSAVKKAAAKK